jgi:FkbM family methyltransferase
MSLVGVASRWSRRLTTSRTRWRWQQRGVAARGVSAPLAFVAGDLRGGTRRHRTHGGHAFLVRHRSRDIDVVAEILGRHAYRMPAAVERRLGTGLTVLDVGANVGLFGVYALEAWPVARLLSFEPDPANAALLERVLAVNDEAGVWHSVQAAVSTNRTPMRFLAEGTSHSRGAREDEAGILVRCVDLFDVLETTGGADVLKLDIEGGEWALLADPRWPAVDARAIVMEWHWRGAPPAGGRAGARAALRQAGFRIVEVPSDAPREDVGLIWGVR